MANIMVVMALGLIGLCGAALGGLAICILARSVAQYAGADVEAVSAMALGGYAILATIGGAFVGAHLLKDTHEKP